MKIAGIIPARYASTRFPGKPLTPIHGKPMIQHVYERVAQVDDLDVVVVATDDQRIAEVVTNFGGQAVMTKSDHLNGTARCAQAVNLINKPVNAVINIQGDEPLIATEQIKQIIQLLQSGNTLASLAKPITELDELINTNVVKIVLSHAKQALFFSRSPIPFIRDIPIEKWLQQHVFYKHIGIYGYSVEVLQAITQLPPCSLEKAESLEQLRWLAHGYPISIDITHTDSIGVDHPEDVKKIETLF